MTWFKEKLLFPLCAIILIAGIFTPYAIKIVHGIYEHKEFKCASHGELHIHEVEFDCDFQKYKLTTQFYPVFYEDIDSPKLEARKLDDNHYAFLSKYQQLHFNLRGPPSIS